MRADNCPAWLGLERFLTTDSIVCRFYASIRLPVTYYLVG